MAEQATPRSHTFILRYVGMSFYWAWVFLSFNSLDITGQAETAHVLVVVHIVSAFAAACMFAFVAIFYRKTMLFCLSNKGVGLIVLSLIAGIGTLLYTFPLFPFDLTRMAIGAAISGIPCSLIVLFWGMAYRNLGAQESVFCTAGTFLVTSVLYLLVANLEAVLASLCVSIFPLLAALSVLSSLKQQPYLSDFQLLDPDYKECRGVSRPHEFKQFLETAFSWKVALGLAATLFAFGGLRIYLGDMAPSIYQNSFVMAGAIAVSSFAFLLYGRFVSQTSLNLGVLYRIAMPLFALGFVLIAVLGNENTTLIFLLISIGSVLFELLTWVLLVEIARTTHFPALFIFAIGRFVVHIGLMAGQLVGVFLSSDFLLFAGIAIPLLILSAGFAFADRDTTFQFEPPTHEELKAITGSGDKGDTLAESPQENSLLEQFADYPLMNEGLSGKIESVAKAYNLSPRETEVFALWVTGHGTKYIQEKLVLSNATIKTHVRHIYEKCDVHNRAELMRRLENS